MFMPMTENKKQMVNNIEKIVDVHFDNLNTYDLYNAYCYLGKYKPNSKVIKQIIAKEPNIEIYDQIYGYEYCDDIEFENQMLFMNAKNME